MQDIAGEVRMNLWAMYSYGPLHTDEQGLGDSLETYLQQLCTDTGYNMEDLPGAMDDRDKLRE